MIICRNCGVELEPDMQVCPLCDLPPVGENSASASTISERKFPHVVGKLTQPQRKATWEIISVIILLVIMVTSLLNFILNKQISWAEYPVAACLVVFSYVSVFAFLNRRFEIRILFVFLMSSLLILLPDMLTEGLDWSVYLGIPLLLTLNILTVAIVQIFKRTKRRGINLIAFTFIAAALLCLSAEAVIDFYVLGAVRLVWSLIVAGSVLPIVTVLLFMHFRLKKGNDLNRTFHV